MKSNIYAKAGLGNNSFLSTEIEKGKKEYRLSKFIIPKVITGLYIMIWIINFGVSKCLTKTTHFSVWLHFEHPKVQNKPHFKQDGRRKDFLICIPTFNGITFKKKSKNKFKFLFGLEGFNRK